MSKKIRIVAELTKPQFDALTSINLSALEACGDTERTVNTIKRAQQALKDGIERDKPARPNQLHKRDEQGLYQGRAGLKRLRADIQEAYELSVDRNPFAVDRALAYLFETYREDSERIITGFQRMVRKRLV